MQETAEKQAKEAPTETRLTVSVYADEKSTEPSVQELTWEDLVAALREVRWTKCGSGCPGKGCPDKSGPAWSPANVVGTRRNANVRSLSALVSDHDHLTQEQADFLKSKLDESGLQHILHPTHSDRPEDRCFRSVLTFSRPVSPEEFPNARQSILKGLGLLELTDPAAKDVSRLSYLPSRPEGSDYTFHAAAGSPIPVDDIVGPIEIEEEISQSPGSDCENHGKKPPTAEEILAAEHDLLRAHKREPIMSTVAAVKKLRNDWLVGPVDQLPVLLRWAATWTEGKEFANEKHIRQKIKNGSAGDQHGKSLTYYRVVQSLKNPKASANTNTSNAPNDGASNVLAQTPSAILRSACFAHPTKTFPTGFEKLDELIGGGYHSRQLAVIAAPTGKGKTQLVIGQALHLQAHAPVLILSTEIDLPEMAARCAAIKLGCKPSDLLSLAKPPKEAAKALDGLRIVLEEVDIFKVRDPIAYIVALAGRVKEAYGEVPIIVVDYLQHLAATDDPDRVRLSVGKLGDGLRHVAKTLDTAVIAVSSVSRAYYGPSAKKMMEGEDDPQAWLAAAKESGAIEYAASVFCYLDVSSESDYFGYSHARLIVAKSRRGRVGKVGLRFHGPSGRFEPSNDALDAMGPSARAANRRSDADRKVQDLVKRRQPITKDKVRSSCGISSTLADEAIERQLEDGRLVYVDIEEKDKAQKRRKIKKLALPGYVPETPKEAE